MKLKQLTPLMVATGLTAMSGFLQAAELEITVQNLTRGIYFTPILITAHSPDQQLFNVGDNTMSVSSPESPIVSNCQNTSV